MKLNLSYNEIVNISGLQVIDGTEYKLSQLELHGNNLMSLDHVTRCLHGATNLRQLVLSQGGAVNPCCHQPRKSIYKLVNFLINQEQNRSIIMGDLNIDLLKINVCSKSSCYTVYLSYVVLCLACVLGIMSHDSHPPISWLDCLHIWHIALKYKIAAWLGNKMVWSGIIYTKSFACKFLVRSCTMAYLM